MNQYRPTLRERIRAFLSPAPPTVVAITDWMEARIAEGWEVTIRHAPSEGIPAWSASVERGAVTGHTRIRTSFYEYADTVSDACKGVDAKLRAEAQSLPRIIQIA